MDHCNYERLITGRVSSFFKEDLRENGSQMSKSILDARIAIVGAAGSIGSSVVKTVLSYKPKAVSLIDISENNLVEVVRDLRSTDGLVMPEVFTALPIGLGTIEFQRYFQETKPFDYILNLSAVKHVRSEKNIYCLIRMLDTNALFLYDFLRENPYRFNKVFSVSSDKAANPANIMGASKMIMEKILMEGSEEQPFSTARFANVAFSDGSLPFGFLRRISKQQPISAPNDVKRYFISHQEAGELCVLSCFLGENRDVFFPKLASGRDEKTFSRIAVELLDYLGYEPVVYQSEEEAKARAKEVIPQKKWPCFFFASDTTGEKQYEEFYTRDELLDMERFKGIGVIKRSAMNGTELLDGFVEFCRRAKGDARITKKDYVNAIKEIVPNLEHFETGRNLDQRM